jgi:hypothetical protein
MKATQGNSLCSYLYLKLAKITYFSFYLLCFSSTKLENSRAEQVLWGGGGEVDTGGRREVAGRGEGG